MHSGHCSHCLIRHPDGFGPGYTPITTAGENQADTGMSFGVLRLAPGETYDPSPELEGALLLLDGQVRLAFDGQQATASRSSLFDEDPTALHFAVGADVSVTGAGNGCELAMVQTANSRRFATALFDAGTMLESEHRGQGRLEDTAYRIVRTIFDIRNRPEASLVLGEVVNFPGRWSSYPPHHHPQPEIYHYRFTAPQGYGHAELGDEVLRVTHTDTVKILDQRDHPQVAAPGYGMYYIWAIRHLPDRPYTVPEFTEAHAWLNQPDPKGVWRPRQRKTDHQV